MVKRDIFDKRGIDTEVNQFQMAVSDNQGILFQECQWDFEVDAKDFVKKFMNSSVAKSMDNTLSPFHNTGIKQIGEAMLLLYDIKPFQGEYKNPDYLYWMGYIYRYWVWWLGDSSEDIYKMADYDTMLTLYKSLHCLSPEQAILKLRKDI